MSWLTRLIHKDPAPEERTQSGFTDIVELTRRADVAGLLRAFRLGDWETRELVAAALGNICRDCTPDVDYGRNEMVAALRDIIDLCTADATGGTYRENCVDHARMLLKRPEFNQLQAAEQEAPVQFSIPEETDGGTSEVIVNADGLRAICIGYTKITPSYEEASALALDLMRMWNPKVYEQIRPDIEVRVFHAPEIGVLSSDLMCVGNADYPDCSTVVQTGEFDTHDRSTGSQVTAAVILTTFWHSDGETRTIVAQGPELTLLPAEPASIEVAEIEQSIPSEEEASATHGAEACATLGRYLRINSLESMLLGQASGLGMGSSGFLVLQFPAGREAQYRLHLALIKRLEVAKLLPPVSIYALRGVHSDASSARLIAFTGSVDAIDRAHRIYYTPEAEDFIAAECGGDWSAINAASSLCNVVPEGTPGDCRIDLQGLSRDTQPVAKEIETGAYEVEYVWESS